MANGMGRQAIAQELDRLGISLLKVNIGILQLSPLLQNEVYLGHIIWGKYVIPNKMESTFVKSTEGKMATTRSCSYSTRIGSIISKANMAHSKRWRPPTIKQKLSNPLAGILLCELCGHSMLYQPRKDRPNPQVRCVQSSCKGVQKELL